MKLDEPKKRLMAGIILLILLVGLCIYYTNFHDENREYPSYNVILSQYPIGELVHVYGDVTWKENNVYRIQDNYKGHLVTMQFSSETHLELGDQVSILGVLGPNNQIIFIKDIEVVGKWNYYFLLLRSFLALAFLLFVFNRYWHFDRQKFEFRRR